MEEEAEAAAGVASLSVGQRSRMPNSFHCSFADVVAVVGVAAVAERTCVRPNWRRWAALLVLAENVEVMTSKCCHLALDAVKCLDFGRVCRSRLPVFVCRSSAELADR